jgi:hypothetical protein
MVKEKKRVLGVIWRSRTVSESHGGVPEAHARGSSGVLSATLGAVDRTVAVERGVGGDVDLEQWDC